MIKAKTNLKLDLEMTVSKALLYGNLIFLLLGILYFGSVHVVSHLTRAQLFMETTKNDFILMDSRSFNRKIQTLLSQGDFLSVINADSAFKSDRQRKFYEPTFLDYKLNLSIYEQQATENTNQIVAFTFSLAPIFVDTFFLMIVMNLAFLALLPFIRKMVENQVQADQLKKAQLQYYELAKKVAHDIRSPLTALEVVFSSAQKHALDEERMDLARRALTRIQGIANDLLKKPRLTSQETSLDSNDTNLSLENDKADFPKLQTIVLEDLLEKVVEEKRLELQNRIGKIELELPVQKSTVFAEATEFGSIVSNLINNSFEAFDKNPACLSIFVRQYNDHVHLIFSDNGRGISEEILGNIGKKGVSYGKADGVTASGSGLGLYYAKAKMSEWKGKLEINSRPSVGTMVTLSFAR